MLLTLPISDDQIFESTWLPSRDEKMIFDQNVTTRPLSFPEQSILAPSRNTIMSPHCFCQLSWRLTFGTHLMAPRNRSAY
ncbi:Uncharacterized protein HZ326_11141 [Fusarium oxysporum f. sp. albedinis]|nr:Uncharacterized protein HZ326_11141 [Fusarium oxysporum f. sp. albedinis]